MPFIYIKKKFPTFQSLLLESITLHFFIEAEKTFIYAFCQLKVIIILRHNINHVYIIIKGL